MRNEGNVKKLIVLFLKKKLRHIVEIKGMLATFRVSVSIIRSQICFLHSLKTPFLQLRTNPSAQILLLQFLLNWT